MSSCPKCKGPMCNIAFMGPAKMVCAAGDDCVTATISTPWIKLDAATMEACREKPGQFVSIRQTAKYSEPSQCGRGWVMPHPPVGNTPTSKQSAQPGESESGRLQRFASLDIWDEPEYELHYILARNDIVYGGARQYVFPDGTVLSFA